MKQDGDEEEESEDLFSEDDDKKADNELTKSTISQAMKRSSTHEFIEKYT